MHNIFCIKVIQNTKLLYVCIILTKKLKIMFLNVLQPIAPDNYVAFTFFIGYIAMLAASVFFFVERGSVSEKMENVSISICTYYRYCCSTLLLHERLQFSYWRFSNIFSDMLIGFLTVPLMCVEFYLLTRIAGATKSLLWKLIFASTWMLVCGYIGEAFNTDGSTSHSVMWGVLSTLGYLYILHSVWMGEVANLADSSGSEVVKQGVRYLAWFVLVGWAIYPIGYMCMDGGWLNGIFAAETLDIWYNIVDVINKIGFGLVVYTIAIAETKKETA